MFALALVLQASLSKDVLVVDALGGGDFTSIQAAVDAAHGGEVLLVRNHSGVFAGFQVDAKPLVITSDHPYYPAQIHGPVRIANLPLGQEIVLAGLYVVPPLGSPQNEALHVTDCAGSIRIQYCSFVGPSNLIDPVYCDGYLENQGFDAAWVYNSVNAAFVTCWFYGGRGSDLVGDLWDEGCEDSTQGGAGGRGFVAGASSVALFACTAEGGAGGEGGWGGDAGHAIVMEASPGKAQVISGSAALGGQGGLGFDYIYGPGGDGGTGLVVGGQTYLLDSSFQGGPGGQSLSFADGVPGPDVQGAATVWTGESRDLRVHGPAKEGSDLKLTFQGQPADYVLLFYSISQSFQVLPQYQGVALIGTAKALPAGMCGATGKLELLVPIPLLEPSFESVVLALQAVFVSTAGEIVAGPPGHAVLLDAAF